MGDHDEAENDGAAVATADDVDDDDAGFSWKCDNTTGSDSVGRIGDVPTGRPKDGGRDTESQKKNSTTTVTMTTANKKVVLGTVDMLGSAGGGSKDVGPEESESVSGVHGLGWVMVLLLSRSVLKVLRRTHIQQQRQPI